jgi:phosphohistidine phosphatase
MSPPGNGGQLILWRHAEAEDAIPGRISDSARALTARGHAQAARIGTWLNRHLPQDVRIVVSPATRTLQTASALSRPFRADDRVGLAASVPTILDACAWPLSDGFTLVVGHQPTLGEVAGILLKRPALQVPRGSIVWLKSTDSTTMLHLCMSPENIPSP